MVITNKKHISNKIYRLRSFGDNDLSYNFRLGELNAAIALSKLPKLKDEIKLRKKFATILAEKFSNNLLLKVRLPIKNTSCSFYRLILEIKKSVPKKYIDKFIIFMQHNKIPISKTWAPLHIHPHFNNKKYLVNGLKKSLITKIHKSKNNLEYEKQNYPVAENLLGRILELQIHPPLYKKNAEYFFYLSEKFSKLYNLNVNEKKHI